MSRPMNAPMRSSSTTGASVVVVMSIPPGVSGHPGGARCASGNARWLPSEKAGSEAPLDRVLGFVRARRPRADRVAQMAAEPGVDRLDAVDRLLDPGGDRLAG